MGGGDLNLKKSWHTGLLSNQKKVWEAETQALAERKKIEQVKRERDDERQIEEIARLAEQNGGPKRLNRVDWMYTGATAGAAGTTEEQEAFLLGKRRVDTILKREDAKQLERAPVVVERDPTKDIASKLVLDPLMLIEKQKHEALEKAMAVQENIERRKRKHEDRDRGSRRHREHRSSRSNRDRSRERSPSRDRSDRHRRNRSRSRDRRDRADRHRRSDRSRSKDRSDRHNNHHRRRSHSSERSQSPPRRRHSPPRNNDRNRLEQHQSKRLYERTEDHRRSRPEQSRKKEVSEEDRQAKLAAMQADASNLEEDRLKRLSLMEEKDREARERDERKRDRGGNFKSALYQQTESI